VRFYYSFTVEFTYAENQESVKGKEDTKVQKQSEQQYVEYIFYDNNGSAKTLFSLFHPICLFVSYGTPG